MAKVIIGIAGKISAGKSTVSKLIAEHFGWPKVSFGDYVRTVASREGLPHNRELLQDLGDKLLKDSPTNFCKQVLSQVNWENAPGLVVEGIRHLLIVEEVKRLASLYKFYLIYVDVSEDVRVKRFMDKEGAILDSLRRIDSHSTETDVVSKLKKEADFIICGSKEISEIEHDLTKYIRSII